MHLLTSLICLQVSSLVLVLVYISEGSVLLINLDSYYLQLLVTMSHLNIHSLMTLSQAGYLVQQAQELQQQTSEIQEVL